MSNDKHHTDKKFEPTDDNEHSDSNKHLDDSETIDSAFSDCSSENGSLSKQVLSDSDYSLDSSHDSDYISKTSSNSFPEINNTGDSNSDLISKELPSSGVGYLSQGTECSSLDNLSDHDGDCISKTSLSDATSSHYSLNGDNVSKKVTSCCKTAEYDRKIKSSSIHDNNSVGKKIKLHSNKVTKVTKPIQSDKMKKLTIPLHKRAKKDYLSTERIKQGLSTNISKDSLYNTPYTNGTINGSLISEEVSKNLVKYMVKCDVKEFIAELNRLAASGNAGDSIDIIKDCLKNLKSELDDVNNLPEVTLSTISTTPGMQINDFKVKLMDLVRFEMCDTNYQQGDIDWDLLWEDIMGDAEKKHSVLKNTAKEMEDHLHCPNGPVVRQDLIVMHSAENPNGECVGS